MKRMLLLLVLALVAADISWGQGCSQCRLLTQQGSELDADSFGTNINYGILYLIAIPYLLLLFFFRKRIAAFFKSFRKKTV